MSCDKRETVSYYLPRQCFSTPEAVINYHIISPDPVHMKKTIVFWMTATPPPPSLPAPLSSSSSSSSSPHLSNSKLGEPYLCLDHASSLVSQVLQGSGNINLFSTCNRPKIGLSSKQRSNPAHICQSLFILGSLWNSAAIENYYIHPSKDLDESHRLFLDKICKRIFFGGLGNVQ